jgi:hypothetical protein
MRFCSRCGFQLEVVSALVTSGGVANAALSAPIQGSKLSPRARGIRNGAKIMFASVVLGPIALAFSIIIESPIPLLFPATIFILGLLWLFYHRLFGEDFGATVQSPGRFTDASKKYLPPHQSIPVLNFGKPAASTAEIAQPPSITENTTRLLDDKG